MALAARVTTALAFVATISFATARAAHGDVPTLADFAACNALARDAAAGSTVPTGADHVRADRARAVAASGSAAAPASVVAADPQIHGMESEGAKDAKYQALYRSCMRRKGF